MTTAAKQHAGSVTAQRLAGMPRDDAGRVVPAVTPWGICRTEFVPDPVYGWAATCDCEDGRGRPKLGELCPMRQRAILGGRACQLCGQPIEGEPFWFLTREPTEPHRDPAFHTGCGRYAFGVCPAMLRYRRDDVGVLVAGCASYETRAVTWRFGSSLLRPAEARMRATEDDPVKWLRALLTSPETYTIENWLRLAAGKDQPA